jgi:hypothetical protein
LKKVHPNQTYTLHFYVTSGKRLGAEDGVSWFSLNKYMIFAYSKKSETQPVPNLYAENAWVNTGHTTNA